MITPRTARTTRGVYIVTLGRPVGPAGTAWSSYRRSCGMRSARIVSLLVLVLACLAVSACGGNPEPAAPPPNATRVYTLDSPTHRNPEGITWDEAGRTFFVGAYNDGTIYRGELDDPTVRPFIEGSPGRSAVGLKVAAGRLYVAGGIYGDLRVYDVATKALVGTFPTGDGGFLNDLVVIDTGDVWVTDSVRPTLWHVSPAQIEAGNGDPTPLPMAPEIEYKSDTNLNGIAALDAHRLLAVRSLDGKIFRVDLDPQAAQGRTITPVPGPDIPGADGLRIDGSRLVVVSFAGLTLLTLNDDTPTITTAGKIEDPSFRSPSTVAKADDRYLVVNADFSKSRSPFTVSSVAI
jgi:sugar lactone lactonase YvrE